MDKNERFYSVGPERKDLGKTIDKIITIASSKGVQITEAQVDESLHLTADELKELKTKENVPDEIFDLLKEKYSDYITGFIVKQTITETFLHYADDEDEFEDVDDADTGGL